MKQRIKFTLASLLLIIMLTFTSSCTMVVAEKHPKPRHRQRTVWVSGIQYQQVYYIENHTNNVIIVNQTEVQHKQPKHKGKKKGHHKD